MDKLPEAERNHVFDALECDRKNIKRRELQNLYPKTYNSWRNGKSRANKAGNWAAEFDDFVEFLLHLGPRPTDEHTLDRTDNSNPNYGPGLCTWRGKKGQANNRDDTILLDLEGYDVPLSVMASLTDQKQATLRDRRNKGWSIYEIINGKASKSGKTKLAGNEFGSNPLTYRPWSKQNVNWDKWEQDFLERADDGEDCYTFFIRGLKEDMAPLTEWLSHNSPGILYEGDIPDLPDGYEDKNLRHDSMVLHRGAAIDEYPRWRKAVNAYKSRNPKLYK